MRTRVISLTVAALLATGAGAAGSARTPPDALPVSSTISIANVELRFHGHVGAALSFCRNHRRVALLKVVHGGPDETMGHARTDAEGRWSIAVSGFAGISLSRFYAVARPRRGYIGQVPYLCDAAASRTIKPGS